MRQMLPGPTARRQLLALGLIGLASALIYAAALLRFPLRSLYLSLRWNLNLYTRSDPTTGVIITIGLLFLFVGYALGGHLLRALPQGGRWLSLLIIGFPLVFIALLVMTQPVTSIDLYDYLFRGRMLAHYQANTFARVPIDYKDDPLYQFVGWRIAVTAYGPLWEAMSWLTAWLAGESPGAASGDAPAATLFRLMLAYKALSVLGFLLCGAAIWRILRRVALEQRWLGLYLWLWNPAVLWESVGVGHNDVWMACTLVLAVGALCWRPAALNANRPAASRAWSPRQLVILAISAFLALTAGGLIKYFALIFGPLALAAALRRLPTWRARLALLLLGGLACGVLAVASYAYFWVGVDTLNNFKARQNLYTATWITVLHGFLATVTSADQANVIASRTSLVLLILGVLAGMWRSWRAPQRVGTHMIGLLLWFLLVCNPWFQPWYVVWMVALVALQPTNTRLVRVVVVFCFTAMLDYIAVAFLLPPLHLSDTSIEWNRLLSAIITLPPFFVLLWSYRAEITAYLQPLLTRLRVPADALRVDGGTPAMTGQVRAEGSVRRLWIYGIVMLVPLVGFSWRYPLGAHSDTLTDIGKLAAYGRNEFIGYVAGMIMLFGCYLLALRESRRLSSQQALPVVLGCGALLALSLVWLYPVSAIDVFLYAVRSRVLTTYGASPISVPFKNYPADPWNRFSTPDWSSRVSPYGPLWDVVAAPVTALSGDRMLLALIGYKILAMICILLGGWVIARTLRAAGRADAASGALLFVWNPLVLWEGVGNGHNDTLLALALVLALLAWVKRWDSLVIPLLVVAALVKYVSLPLIPLAVVALWCRATSGRERWRIAWQSIALSLVAIAIPMYPAYDFGALPASIQQQGTIIYTSPTAVAVALLNHRYSFQQIVACAMLAGQMLVLLALVWQAVMLWQRPGLLPRAFFELTYVLLLVGLASSRSWYLVWLVGFAALLPWGWPAWRTIAWTIGGMAGYGFLIWIEAWWQPGYDKAQIVGWLVIAGPTLLVTLAEWLSRPIRHRSRGNAVMVAPATPQAQL